MNSRHALSGLSLGFSHEVCAIADRIKRLCDQLEQVQNDTQERRTLVKEIREEVNAFQQYSALRAPFHDVGVCNPRLGLKFFENRRVP